MPEVIAGRVTHIFCLPVCGSVCMPDDGDVAESASNPFVGRGPDGIAGDLRILETVVDDVSPELLGGLQATLTAVGAHQVSVLGVTTKDSRPGHLVRATVHPDDADTVAHTLAKETGSHGVRELRAAHRFVAETDTVTATIEIGDATYELPVKRAWMDGTVYDVSAEYEPATRIAEQTDHAVRTVMDRAEASVDDTD